MYLQSFSANLHIGHTPYCENTSHLLVPQHLQVTHACTKIPQRRAARVQIGRFAVMDLQKSVRRYDMRLRSNWRRTSCVMDFRYPLPHWWCELVSIYRHSHHTACCSATSYYCQSVLLS